MNIEGGRIGWYTLLLCLVTSKIFGAVSLADQDTTYQRPMIEHLRVIQKATDSYPLEKTLIKPRRYFFTNNDGVDLTKENVTSAQDYSQTTFNKPVKFFLMRFSKQVRFVLSIFKDQLIIANTTFNEFINFEWAIFDQKTSFTYCRFEKEINFYQSVFRASVSFYGSKFYDANFTDVQFKNGAIFNHSNFINIAEFVGTNFSGYTAFDDVQFGHIANFNQAIFNGNITFSQAKFGEKASFSSAQFNGAVIFRHAKMPAYLDFSNVKVIKNPIEFNALGIQSNDTTRINLVGTLIPQLILDYSQFSLYFPKGTSDTEINTVYEKLIKVQQDNGFNLGYKKLVIEYKTYKYKKSGQYIQCFFDKYMWDFGFDKAHLISIVLYLLLLFTIINTIFYRELVHSVYRIDFLDFNSHNKTIEDNWLFRYLFYLPLAFIYTIIIFLSGFLGLTAGLQSIKKKHIFFGIYFVVMIVCGVLSTFIMLKFVII